MKKKNQSKPSPRGDASEAAAALPSGNGHGELKELLIGEIRPDPDQPRKTFDQAKLEELAESIRRQGILQPLVVSHVPGLKLHEPDMVDPDFRVTTAAGTEISRAKQENQAVLLAGGDSVFKEHYQLIFGERRWRAAQLVGLRAVPAIVRAATERDRFALQWIENTQREAVTALEEAEALAAQLQKRREAEPSVSAEDLAAELGMGRATIYKRMTLTRLHPPVREALLAGKISPSHAERIAIIPLPKQQEKLLKQITNEDDYRFPYSVRDVEELVERDYVQQLDKAEFDLKATYEGVENPGPCASCPHRTGNMLDAHPELKNKNACTLPTCFAAKQKAHWKELADKAENKGQKVMQEREFKGVKEKYVRGEAYEYTPGRSGTFEQLMGKHKPEPVLVITAKGIEKFYEREEATAAMKANGVKVRKAQPEQTAEEREALEAEQQKAEANKVRRLEVLRDCLPTLGERFAKLTDKQAIEEARKFADEFETPYWREDYAEKIVGKSTNAKCHLLAILLNQVGLSVLNGDGSWNKDELKLFKRFDIDLEAEDKKCVKALEPTLPLGKPDPKQKELDGMPAASRKAAKAAKKKKGGKK